VTLVTFLAATASRRPQDIGNTAEACVASQLLQGDRERLPPVRVLIDSAGKIHLLLHTQKVFQRDH
jgi:hypothetical protein